MPTIDECATHVEIENKEQWQDHDCQEDGDLDINYIVHPDARGDKAIFSLNTYISNARKNDNAPTDKYNCGREGCLAGWYAILGTSQGFLSKVEQSESGSYDIGSLARHFGISRLETNNLFGSLGKGVEGFPEEEFDAYGDGHDGWNDMNKSALDSRESYLEELFQRYEIDTGE